MGKETTDFHEFRDGDYYARKAAEHSASCSDAENVRRRENGRKSNVVDSVAWLPDYEVSDIPFSGFGRTLSLDN
jgi:hypothetical protein